MAAYQSAKLSKVQKSWHSSQSLKLVLNSYIDVEPSEGKQHGGLCSNFRNAI